MANPEAIGFDLFNTLLTVHPSAMGEAQERQLQALHQEGIRAEAEPFREAYVEAAIKFLRAAHKEGKETHNRFWVAAALETIGYCLAPEDSRIESAVDAYFSAFYDHCELVPGTKELLGELAERYPLGMLTNFTHPPAVMRIIDLMGLDPFFRTVLVSGDLGYRKPHPSVFAQLVAELGVPADKILFVGDDLEADVQGAREAGLQAVITTCVQDANLPAAKTPLSPTRTEVPPDVPRISRMQDLLALLEG